MFEQTSRIDAPVHSPWLELIGQLVVIDLASPFVYLGRLIAASEQFVVLDEADAHDLRDTSTTRERYVLDCRLHGIRPNRRRVWLRMGEIVGISRLDDVVIG
jgi:hypothetical protein